MATQTVSFQEITLRGAKSVKCAGNCGRTLKRQRKFWQTLNPFNKNACGQIKGVAEIRVELENERKAWLLDEEFCKYCGG